MPEPRQILRPRNLNLNENMATALSYISALSRIDLLPRHVISTHVLNLVETVVPANPQQSHYYYCLCLPIAPSDC